VLGVFGVVGHWGRYYPVWYTNIMGKQRLCLRCSRFAYAVYR